MTGCMSLEVTVFFDDTRTVPFGTKTAARGLPVTTSRLELLRLVGVPMNIGLGSFSFSSSLPGSGCAPSGAKARTNNSEVTRMRLVIEVFRTGSRRVQVERVARPGSARGRIHATGNLTPVAEVRARPEVRGLIGPPALVAPTGRDQRGSSHPLR